MAFGSTPADINNIPMGCVYVPGVGLKALQGGTLFTDGSSNDSAPGRMELTGSSKATYAATISGNAAYATPTDLFVLPGSATKLVKVVRCYLSSAATAAGVYTTHFVKRTAANTGGTSAAMTITKMDSGDGAVTAAPVSYSVVPTSVGTGSDILAVRLFQNTLTGLPERFVLDFGNYIGEPLALRGVAQALAINFNAVALPAGSVFDVTFIWTEE